MAILTDSGRTALAIAVAAQPLALAWGSGLSSWDTTPVAEDPTATTLVAEVGRRLLSSQQYVVPATGGSIVVPTGTYNPSGTPTNNLYLSFNFAYTDGSTNLIRELGVFMGTVVETGLPGGQMYFLPGQITTPGTLLALQHIPVITRSGNTSQSFEFVLTF